MGHPFGRRRERTRPEDEGEPSLLEARPTEVLEPLELATRGDRTRRAWFRTIRPTPVALFAVGFLFLLGAVAAAGFAHFTASGIAPWLSIGYSGVAVICTVAALMLARER